MEASPGFQDRVALADEDAELVRGTPPEELALLRRVLQVPAERIERGPWSPGTRPDGDGAAFSALLVDGLIAWDVTLSGRVTTVLLGPGDVLAPWTRRESMIEASMRYTALTPSRVALLEARFLLAARRWPGLVVRLHERLVAQAQRAAVDAALSHLPNAELRVLGLLWHLADRWGRVGSVGVIVPLKLTHEALGRMIGAERPTVTLALRDLARSGAVERRTDGAWVLHHGSQELLAKPDPGDGALADPVVAAILEPLERRVPAAPSTGEPVIDGAAVIALADELDDAL